jgi:predicted lipid-binding transport protein (Tim44 family)
MGLIKSIFGAIFGLIGGIFKTVGGLVGLGKKSEFYLEFTEAESGSKPEAALAPAAKPAAKSAAKPAASDAVASTAKPVAVAPMTVAPAPAPVVAASVAQPAQPAGPLPNFATDYVAAPTATSLPRRRRPGPSMSPFVDMAKAVKSR